MKNVIIGTAGHVDHGKSALVEALTGTHPDRLAEEKRRGITLDLGFAFLALGELSLGFVDVPGHERFVRNMLAGAGGFDLVLLVVAADESVMPQTREHFDICRLLEIPRGLVAITKSDLVDSDTLGLVRLEVEDFLRGSFLEGAPIVSVSAKSGQGMPRTQGMPRMQGMEDLRRELARLAAMCPEKDSSRYFRLPIDRAFAMKGFGTVVTGTLISGQVKPEDEVELFPARRRVRIRGVQSGGKPLDCAKAGQRTALNLAGVELSDVLRGMTLAAPGRFETTRQLDARVTLLPSARRLKHRAKVHFHQGATETIAEIHLLRAPDQTLDHVWDYAVEIAPGNSALAQLRLADPLLLLPGDRFILRQFSPVVTIGGGIVLDALAPRHRARGASPLPLLAALESAVREESDSDSSHADVLAALAQSTPAGLTLGALVARTGWAEGDIRGQAEKLEQAARLRIVSQQPFVAAAPAAVEACAARILKEVERFHRANPLVEAVSKEDLRERTASQVRPEVFRAALDDLARAQKVTLSGDLVKRTGHAISLLPEEIQAKQQIEQEFARAGLTVPAVKDVLAKLPVESRRAQKLLQLLLREGTLLRVSDQLIFHRSALEHLRLQLAEYKRVRGDRLPISAFKEMAGGSRKYAIPLLEYLDKEQVTRRVGDDRVIL